LQSPEKIVRVRALDQHVPEFSRFPAPEMNHAVNFRRLRA
jgi:hypothetical protein